MNLPVQKLSHTKEIQRLYRKSLKLAQDWYWQREEFRQKALVIREAFEAKRGLVNPQEIQAAVLNTERLLAKYYHPQPYICPTAPGGSKWERNIPVPEEERRLQQKYAAEIKALELKDRDRISGMNTLRMPLEDETKKLRERQQNKIMALESLRAREEALERDQLKKEAEKESERIACLLAVKEMRQKVEEDRLSKLRQIVEIKSSLDEGVAQKREAERQRKQNEHLLDLDCKRFSEMKLLIAKKKKERELERARKEEIARAKAQAFTKEIELYRRSKITEAEREQDKLKSDSLKERHLLENLYKEEVKKNELEKHKRIYANRQLKKYHELQMTENHAARNNKLDTENDFYNSQKDTLKNENEKFQEYANNMIQDFKDAGKDVRPMLKSLQDGTERLYNQVPISN
ncbi:hypothetical protein HDU96_005487 [Phlyctochytrium bullatum]|nr:hypothetical protein HDU96_005487 [Phlyctochytrium bullatum]